MFGENPSSVKGECIDNPSLMARASNKAYLRKIVPYFLEDEEIIEIPQEQLQVQEGVGTGYFTKS
jgi:hypothetical protein